MLVPGQRFLLSTLVAVALVVTACSGDGQAPVTPPASSDQAGSTMTTGTTSDRFAGLVRTVQENIARHWPRMGDIWPGVDYARHNLILFQTDEDGAVNEAWLANRAEARKLEKEEYATVTVPEPDGYVALTYDGQPSIAMTVDLDHGPDAGDGVITYRIATHELVHFYYQDEAAQTSMGSRAQPYPLELEPRLYRAMVYENLIRAYDNPDQEAGWLAKAKYWQDKWATEYADEARDIHDTDIAEGTARYIEMMGLVAGENLSDSERAERLGSEIPREEVFTAAESESYELGHVAGLLLDRTKPGWQTGFFARGETLVDELLASVTPTPEQPDDGVKERVTKAIEGLNQDVSEELKDLIEARKDTSVPMLKVDITDVDTSYGATGAFLLDGADEASTGYQARYRTGDGEILANRIAAQFEFTEDGRMSVLFPLTMAHTVESGVLTVDSPSLSVTKVAVETTTEDGRTVYAVTADS